MATDWTIGFVGAGVMAETMITGLRAQGVPAHNIRASHPREVRRVELADRHGIEMYADNPAVVHQDVVVLAVKPQTLAGVVRGLAGTIPADRLVLSIVAGARIGALQRGLGHARVARCMPNLPCRIHQGVTVWSAPAEVGPTDRARIRAVLQSMGTEIEVAEETHVDRATAVSGTGPAIVAHFVKAWLEAAGYIGEPRGLARETVLATLLGTAEMIRRSDAHVAELIDEVTSPGGTTTRALQELKNGRFSAVLTDAVDAAWERSRELGDQLEASLMAPPVEPPR